MNIEWVREYCLSLPHVTETMQWGETLVYKIGGKIFAVMALEVDAKTRLAFKCTPEKFSELIEVEGVVPAPYMAKNHWVALETLEVLRSSEVKERLRNAYDLIFAKLPRKTQAELKSALKPKKKSHSAKASK